ncbi:MAG: hypothetical protein JW986_05915 [Methanotrichaceae archaeon]|nr:hypothetical protein [Methanotrichaceae archaeon]
MISEAGRQDPLNVEEVFAGFCYGCGEGELHSLAFYREGDGWQVAARCKECGIYLLLRYDRSWNWLDDEELEVVEAGPVLVSTIPREQLDAVFTSAEIRDMIACEENRPFTRQNLYRARSKYDRFESLFGVRIQL